MLLGLEHDEREAVAVDRLKPIPRDEPRSGSDLGQDVIRERAGCRWRLLRVDRQIHERCVHGLLRFVRCVSVVDESRSVIAYSRAARFRPSGKCRSHSKQ
jgi:hypothetical protein